MAGSTSWPSTTSRTPSRCSPGPGAGRSTPRSPWSSATARRGWWPPTSPATATAGAPFDVTLEAFDAYGNVAAGFRGTVQFATDDPNASVSLPADYTFTDADAGAHAFPGGFSLRTAGTTTVSVTAEGLPTI